jgi:riboflavin kinase/FMN adenylyltransferase
VRVVRGRSALTPGQFQNAAVTLGVFDGVHLGHRRLLDRLKTAARAQDGEAVVVTFDRHPRGVVGSGAPPTITSLEHRLVLFEREAIDGVLVLNFDKTLASVPADTFVREILCAGLGARTIVLGEDAHFGRGRAGNLTLLAELSHELGYVLEPVSLLEANPPEGAVAELVISSTAIRQAIAAGRLADAQTMLGRPVSLLGRVIRGQARGRTLGFPTANLDLHQEITPPRGVYAGEVEVDRVIYPTMQNLGIVPTFDGGAKERLEVHLIGFRGDLYGRVLDVRFLRKLREERKFSGIDELKAQLQLDRTAALRVTESGA